MLQQQNDNGSRTNVQNNNNGVKQHQQISNNSAINQTTATNNNNCKVHHQSKSSFIKFLNPFSSSKSNSKSQTCSEPKSNSDQYTKSVKALKQFWNDQIKTAKSSENLSRKSDTFKYFSQSTDSINECSIREKSLTLDGSLRYPLDDFNKFKDANFVRTKKSKLYSITANGSVSECNGTKQLDSVKVTRYSRPESLNDNHFPQISATGGKIHWAKRDDIFTAKKSPVENTNKNSDSVMSVKTNKTNESTAAVTSNCNGKCTPETNENVSNKSSTVRMKSSRSDSMNSSITGSIGSSTASSNGASRKISFKTNPSTTSSYMNKKLAANSSSNSNKVAQIAQRFNQIIQQDATILDEVKKHGGLVVHRSGGRVFKIKEEKAASGSVSDKASPTKKSINNASEDVSDDAISLPSIGKNSTRKKSTLRKRPSIRIMVESSRKDGNGNVLSKRQLYEANVINKETIVIKPKVPDKSERVLAKTKELKSKKMLNEIMKTDAINTIETNAALSTESEKQEEDSLPKIDETTEPSKDTSSRNNFRKIYDKLTFRSTFLYGKKSNSKPESITTKSKEEADEMKIISTAEHNKPDESVIKEIDDYFELKPIDLNLNVYFNDENLSTNSSEECKNISSQGSSSDVTTTNANNKPDIQTLIDMKPNESFLFRTQPTAKFDTACDTFIRSMLNENSPLNDADNVEAEAPSITDLSTSISTAERDDQSNVECKAYENDYEIISREEPADIDSMSMEKMQKRNVECDDIGDKKNDGDNSPNGRESNSEKEPEEDENIYQSLCEVKGSTTKETDTISVRSYESFENYDEIKQSILDNKIDLSDILKGEDDYIFPEAIKETPPELPAPRQKHSIPKISSPILTSTTSNLVQANLSVPKLCNVSSYELQKSNSCSSTTYEKIKYDQLPQHSKQQHTYQPLPPRNNITSNTTSVNKNIQQSTENIYDTIKNGDTRSISTDYEKIPDIDNGRIGDDCTNNLKQKQDGSESFDMNDDGDNPYKNSKNDTMSIISNCYESISLKQSYSTINQILRHAISTTTLSSEHRINSIYGIGQSLTPPSGGSDNSDEWIDVESEEETENNDRFIV